MNNLCFEPVGLTTPGKRLYYLRFNLCSNRKIFSQQHNLSVRSLASWETDVKPLTEKAAKKFVEIFGKQDILCTSEWLLQGKGHPPTSLKQFTTSLEFPEKESVNIPSLPNFGMSAEVILFTKTHPHSKIFKMEDDSMEPVFYKGDLLGGVLKNQTQPKAFLDKPCAIVDENGISHIRFPLSTQVKNHYNLVALNPKTQSLNPVQFKVNPKEIYKIIWVRREDDS